MIELLPAVDLHGIQEQRRNYMMGLPYVQELYAEERVWESEYFIIKVDSAMAGYICVGADKTLYEFYLMKSALLLSQEIFKYLIDMKYITSAYCKSFDHLLLSLCFDFYKQAVCSAYMFRDDIGMKDSSRKNMDIFVRLAGKDDIGSIIEMSGDFFCGLEENISREEVFVFYADDVLLGAGSCKKVWDGMNFYDIGMVVAEGHRNKGIGTFIISNLKEYCYNNGRIPVCGCSYKNHASKKTLEKAGFAARHRIIKFEFIKKSD